MYKDNLLYLLHFILLCFRVFPLHLVIQILHELSLVDILSSGYCRCVVLEDALHVPGQVPGVFSEFRCSSHNQPQPL